MTTFIHSLLFNTASVKPDNKAISDNKQSINYADLANATGALAKTLVELDLNPSERVGIFLPKLPETVIAFFGVASAGGVFVPINPLLKSHQATYILNDCNIRILITHMPRLKLLQDHLPQCPDLHTIVCVDKPPVSAIGHIRVLYWQDIVTSNQSAFSFRRDPATDSAMAAIMYTSGSTGNPKGVVLSHRNMVVGAESVSSYLENTEQDKILAVLPFSFDYGLSQLTTAFKVGASCHLLDYLLPNDIRKVIEVQQITGLAAVPPLWSQLTKLDWQTSEGSSLRYFTNSGGAMPEATLHKLESIFANAKPYLMYGLTEAFRSTYLPPPQAKVRPTSMGKAIPNADIKVVRPNGEECAPNEPGELVHSGPLVSMGYWNAPEKTAERFKPTPGMPVEITTPQLSVWSGDTVYRDQEGYLYFVGRMDDMIKTSGYRVSPTEVEEAIYDSGYVIEAAALGLSHADFGQAIVVIATTKHENSEEAAALILKHCQKQLPNFMVPKKVLIRDSMPHNANGKIDRKELGQVYKDLFAD